MVTFAVNMLIDTLHCYNITGHEQKSSDTQSECSENSLGWVVTPPSCGQGEGQAVHNSMEDLLIEHPSMSVYIRNDEFHEEVPAPPHEEQQVEDNRVAVRPMAHIAALHPVVRSAKQYPKIINKIPKLTKKATKRHNQQKNNSGKFPKNSKKCHAMRQGCFNAGRRHC